MNTFADLAKSRRDWIQNVLTPWCLQATRKELLQAEHEWVDVAGKVDPVKTLWFWAWSRFPELVNAELFGIDETHEVTVTLADGQEHRGYPDARESEHGELVILGSDPNGSRRLVVHGPFSIDDIRGIRSAKPSSVAGLVES